VKWCFCSIHTGTGAPPISISMTVKVRTKIRNLSRVSVSLPPPQTKQMSNRTNRLRQRHILLAGGRSRRMQVTKILSNRRR
jgi:2-C-methyl-D-erythritol 4-phosphate cytidylyltransferase